MFKDRGLNPDFHLPSNIANHNKKLEIAEGKTGIPILDAADKLKKTLDETEQRAKKAEKESVIDFLTGCYNRNYFEKFKQEHFDPNRDNNRIGLVFIDINNLKTINDTQGHQAGDALIKNTANFLKSNFRKDDTVVRLGGDEFIVICRNHNNSPNFEEKLFNKITERLLKHPDKNLAFGVAVYDKNQDFSNLNKTKDRADTQMYQNKREMKAGK